MNAIGNKVEITASLALNIRELQLLNHICSYGANSFAGMVSSSYADGVSLEEIKKFITAMRTETDKLLKQIEDGKIVIFKGKEYLAQSNQTHERNTQGT